MIRVNDWSATRSGATMTVTGTEADLKQPVRLTGVDQIKVGEGEIVAIRDGRIIATLLS